MEMLNDLLTLRKRAKYFEDLRVKYSKQNFIKQWILRNRITALDIECIVVEREFQKLQKVAKYRKLVSPTFYLMKLFAGVLFAIIFIIWIVQTSLCELENQQNLICKHEFLSKILIPLSENGWSMISTFIFLAFFGTMLYGAYMGNRKFGMRFYFITYYPMIQNETLFNGLCYNIILLNLWTTAIVQLSVSVLREWMCTGQEEGGCNGSSDIGFDPSEKFKGRTAAYVIWNHKIRTMIIHRWFYDNNVFIYMMLACFVIATLYLLIRPDDMKARSSARKAAKDVNKRLEDRSLTSSTASYA